MYLLANRTQISFMWFSLIDVHPPLQRGLHTGCWGWSRCRTCSRTTCPCTTMTQRPEHSSPLSDPTKYQKSKRFQVSTYVHIRYPLFCCYIRFFVLSTVQHKDSHLINCLDCDRLVHLKRIKKVYWKKMSRISICSLLPTQFILVLLLHSLFTDIVLCTQLHCTVRYQGSHCTLRVRTAETCLLALW